jgi:hypothetical protein
MKSFRTFHWVTFFLLLCPAVAIASSSGMSGTEAATAQATVSVGVDSRVELVAELCRLAGYDEYKHSLMPNYAESVDAYFNRYATLPAVQTFNQLRKTGGLGYDGPMGLALLLPASPAGKPQVSAKEMREDQITLDIKDAQAFLNAAQRFRRDTGADSFFAAQRPLYLWSDRTGLQETDL